MGRKSQLESSAVRSLINLELRGKTECVDSDKKMKEEKKMKEKMKNEENEDGKSWFDLEKIGQLLTIKIRSMTSNNHIVFP